MKQHLRFDLLWAPFNRVKQDHPSVVMKEFGITYQQSTPQPQADEIWYWNCENIPDPLPDFLSVLEIEDPREYAGFGLTKENAEKIYKKQVEK